MLEQQHKIFIQARRRKKRAQKRRNERVNAERKVVELKAGDPVYYKIHQREGKLDQRWEPYYWIVEQTGPVSYVIWDQVSGRARRAHANDLKAAEIANLEMSEPRHKKTRTRKVTLVEPEEMETEEDSEENEEIGRLSPLDKAIRMTELEPSAGTGGVQSSPESVQRIPCDVTISFPCPKRGKKKTRKSRQAARGSKERCPKQDEELSEWEEEDQILLSQLRERLRNRGDLDIESRSNENVQGADLKRKEESGEKKRDETPPEEKLNAERLEVKQELPLEMRLRGVEKPKSQ